MITSRFGLPARPGPVMFQLSAGAQVDVNSRDASPADPSKNNNRVVKLKVLDTTYCIVARTGDVQLGKLAL